MDSFAKLTNVVFHSAPGANVPGSKCDQCHDRKVRCKTKDTAKCKSCTSLGLDCKYTYLPKPRRRKKRTKNIFSGVKLDDNGSSPFAIINFNSIPQLTPPPRALDPVLDFSLPHFRDLEKYSLSSTCLQTRAAKPTCTFDSKEVRF
ncbi:hypothetical protein DSO57_1013109 [Entomophthora muscae]|uniref:Uncharacterized protein n=1 Tax=Entomophthora muscae TaxID=34485 RepID=A0ACC2U3K1_9FUNG|nr:hypothetical protein DSO57_1013109 [Entomophthora muscae]